MPPELFDPLELPRMMLETQERVAYLYCFAISWAATVLACAFGRRR